MASGDKAATDRVPYGQIRWWVGQQHVSRPMSDVGDDIARMMRGVTVNGKGEPIPPATDDEVARAVAHALECHGENRRQYVDLMGGGV